MADLLALRDLDSGTYMTVEPKERWFFVRWLNDTIVLSSYGAEFRFMASHVVRAGLMKPEWLQASVPEIPIPEPEVGDEISIVENEDRCR